jgi:hypothetical protein
VMFMSVVPSGRVGSLVCMGYDSCKKSGSRGLTRRLYIGGDA